MSDELQTYRLPDGRLVHYGQEVTVRRWRGRYRWLGMLGQDGSLTLHGSRRNGYPSHTRAARPDAIVTVHRMPKEQRPSKAARRAAGTNTPPTTKRR